jgi:hypothetical protein
LLPDVPEGEMAEDIQTLLLDFHRDVVSGDYRAAWSRLSDRKRAQVRREDGYPAWRTAQSSLAGFLDPEGLEVVVKRASPSTGVALVNVTGMTWSQRGASCSEWSGLTWVKYEGDQWTYDPGYSTTRERERAWKSRFDQLLGTSC